MFCPPSTRGAYLYAVRIWMVTIDEIDEPNTYIEFTSNKEYLTVLIMEISAQF